MKKILLVIGIVSIAILAFGAVGYAYAQNQTPPDPDRPYGPGMMGNYDDSNAAYGPGMMAGFGRGYGRGMRAMSGVEGMGWDGEEGPMHESMIAALAEALNLTPEELEARHDAGETMWQIAESGGLSPDQIQELMLTAHDTALEDAVADGWMTEEQAEWMDSHMEQMWSGDYQDGGFGGHCGGSLWQADN